MRFGYSSAMASLRRVAEFGASALLLVIWGCDGRTSLEHDRSAAAGPDDPSNSGTQVGSAGVGGGSSACSAGEARCNGSFRRETCTKDGVWIETDFVCARTVAVDDDIGSYCVTKANGTYRCWRSETSDAVEARPLPDETYRRVQLTRYGLIGLTEDGRLRAAEFTIPESPSKVVTFRQTNMWGNVGVCSLQSDGSFAMFLYNPRDPDGPSTSTESVEGQFSHVYCAWEGMYTAVRTDGTVLLNFTTPPLGNDFAELALSIGIFCGLRTDGAISCHRPFADSLSIPSALVGPNLPAFPSGRYRSITATTGAICAIDEQDALVCKRYDGQDMPVPPARYTFAEGGNNVVCAVRTDGTTACFRHGGVGNLDLDNVSDFAPVEPPLDPDW